MAKIAYNTLPYNFTRMLPLPLHATAQRLIDEYLTLAGHREDAAGPLFRPVKNNITRELDRPLNPNSVYRNIVQKYGLATGVSSCGMASL